VERKRVQEIVSGAASLLMQPDSAGLDTEIRSACDVLSLLPENGECRRVLDLSIDRGLRSIPLTSMNYRVDATDSCSDAKSESNPGVFEKFGVRVRSCDLSREAIPYSDSSFDWVLVSGVPARDKCSCAHVFSEIKRVMSNQSRLILQAPNPAVVEQTNRQGKTGGWGRGLGQIRISSQNEVRQNDNGLLRDLCESLEQYGLHTVLKLYRQAERKRSSGVAEKLASIRRVVFPHLRDTVIMVCRKK